MRLGSGSLAVAVFVKTPGLSPIKTRLAKGLGEQEAATFYALSCAAIQAVLARTCGGDPVRAQAYWAVAENAGLGHWSAFPCLDQGGGGLGERLDHVYATLRERYARVALIGADAPQIGPEHFADVQQLLDADADFVIGPAEDGGFYLFAGRKAVPATLWIGVPYSDQRTAVALADDLRAIGKVSWLAPLTDVDVAEDLAALRAQLSTLSNPLPEQLALLGWLDCRGRSG